MYERVTDASFLFVVQFKVRVSYRNAVLNTGDHFLTANEKFPKRKNVHGESYYNIKKTMKTHIVRKSQRTFT